MSGDALAPATTFMRLDESSKWDLEATPLLRMPNSVLLKEVGVL
jgi:hypothetical protein